MHGIEKSESSDKVENPQKTDWGRNGDIPNNPNPVPIGKLCYSVFDYNYVGAFHKFLIKYKDSNIDMLTLIPDYFLS